jgi:tellurite resistance protein TerC
MTPALTVPLRHLGRGGVLEIDEPEKRLMEISTLTWFITCAMVVALFAFDLVMVAHRPHAPRFRESVMWYAVWLAIALAFGVFVALKWGGDYGSQYFAGYVTEEALSVDNLFVFAVIMSSLAVPRERQQKVLLVGIAMALGMRAVFIALGAAAISAFSWVFYVFGAALILTAYKLIRDHGHDTDEPKVAAIVRRVAPAITPTMLALVVIGLTDLLFALDSIPAIFGLTDEAYIVLTANAFALMGLRYLYFLISGLLDRLVYLSYGLAVILAFIGVKLILHALHEHAHLNVPEISTGMSFAVIASVLVITTITSLWRKRVDKPTWTVQFAATHREGGHHADSDECRKRLKN